MNSLLLRPINSFHFLGLWPIGFFSPVQTNFARITPKLDLTHTGFAR